MRFGFIADELESVVPQVVRTTSKSELQDQKSVVYQDLIALIASAQQAQQVRIDKQEVAIKDLLQTATMMKDELKTVRKTQQERRKVRESLRRQYLEQQRRM